MKLTDKQKQLAEQHLPLVGQVIRNKLYTAHNDVDMGWDELQQIGCMALCRAVTSYDSERPFAPYARTAIRNALYDHCRKIRRKKELFCSIDGPAERDMPAGEEPPYLTVLPSPDMETQWAASEVYACLVQLEEQAGGTQKAGIHVLRLKLAGYSSTEISKMYGVKPTLVRTWMSRAVKKLRVNEELKQFIS